MTPRQALDRLREGNHRFAANLQSLDALLTHTRRGELASGQHPFAIVLGCSDSRVPAETIFDQGLGELFVIRVAGNIVGPSQVGSVEFAVARFCVRLVVVLGHSSCGAVVVTLEELQRPAHDQNFHPTLIIDRVRPAIEGLLATELVHDPEALVRHAVRANVRSAANQLREGSALLAELTQKGEVVVVGAEYSLESGLVDFFDGCPAPLERGALL